MIAYVSNILLLTISRNFQLCLLHLSRGMAISNMAQMNFLSFPSLNSARSVEIGRTVCLHLYQAKLPEKCLTTAENTLQCKVCTELGKCLNEYVWYSYVRNAMTNSLLVA